jgi:chromosome segregation ATPase
MRELSLVDNPANQFANIFSIEKVDGVDVMKGEAVDTVLENVFYDQESGLVMVSENDSETSPLTGNTMQNIGFVEKMDNEKTEMIKFLVDSAKGIDLSKMNKEVSPMTEDTTVAADEVVVEKSDEVAPEADTTVEKSEETTEAAAEEAAVEATEAVEASEEVVEKADTVSAESATEDAPANEVSKSEEVVTAAIAEIRDGITTAFSDLTSVVKSLNDEIADLKKSLSLVNAKLDDAESDFNNIGKRIDAVEADTAFRKSGDLGEIVQEQPNKVEKSLWGGRFLKTADLFR